MNLFDTPPETPAEFTALFPFCGLGAGALGFLQAQSSLMGRKAKFTSVGGIDNDADACADFEMLTGSPALCADIATLTPMQLRAFAGDTAPDVVFLSPPCKGFSGLLSKAKSTAPKYLKLNRLVLDWIACMLRAWGNDPPKLVLLENVPRIASRGRRLLRAVKRMLSKAGYVFHATTHDCGELGGLAQRRKRYLLVARHPAKLPPLLYQPHKLKVRACGEVLSKLPLPNDPAAGPMHVMPRLSWMNWVRLSMIPAGGDWRDLPGVLETGQARREVHRRHHVGEWDKPVATVAGSGSNGVGAIADPRVALTCSPRAGAYGVQRWDAASKTVTGAARHDNGPFSVADPRVKRCYDHGYAVLRWDEASSTIAGGSHPGQGAYSVADPRLPGPTMAWRDAKRTLDEAGPWAVVDKHGEPVMVLDENPKRPPPLPPVILAEDGTWHRPITTLELAALQGLPTELDGKPLQLSGHRITGWRERIGNAVPPPTARAIATQMLECLQQGDADAFVMQASKAVWVAPIEVPPEWIIDDVLRRDRAERERKRDNSRPRLYVDVKVPLTDGRG